MDKDFRKPVYTLLGLFGLLGVLILVFMLTGDMTAQPSPPLHALELGKPANVTQVRATQPSADILQRNFSLPAVQYSSPADDTLDKEVEAFLQDGKEPLKELGPKTSPGNCPLEDGSYKATVSYSDPSLGSSSKHNVDITVLNCQVIAMDLPKLGWLDGDQFVAATINEKGEASFEDNKRRLFEVHIGKPANK